jgi:hypothetical protein
MYVFGYKLSLSRFCDSDFGITPIDDITVGISCAVLCFHIAHISFAPSWHLLCLSVIVLARLCVFGTAMCTGDSYVYWGQLCVFGTAMCTGDNYVYSGQLCVLGTAMCILDSYVYWGQLCVFWTAMCIKKVFFDFLFMKVMSGRLEGIFLSVIMLRFQYSLKLSFSSTLAGVYCISDG